MTSRLVLHCIWLYTLPFYSLASYTGNCFPEFDSCFEYWKENLPSLYASQNVMAVYTMLFLYLNYKINILSISLLDLD